LKKLRAEHGTSVNVVSITLIEKTKLQDIFKNEDPIETT